MSDGPLAADIGSLPEGLPGSSLFPGSGMCAEGRRVALGEGFLKLTFRFPLLKIYLTLSRSGL